MSDVPPDPRTPELTLFLRYAWRHQRRIICIEVMVLVAAVILAFVLPKSYRAETLLEPVVDHLSVANGMGSFPRDLGGGLGGLGALVGGGKMAEREALVAFLSSDDLARDFITQEELGPVLYAGLWDDKTHQWKVQPAPTLEQQAIQFRNLRKVTYNNRTGLIRLSIDARSAQAAATLTSKYVALANKEMRDRQIAESDSYINYLEVMLKDTSDAEMRNALLSLMQQQVGTKMMASAGPEFSYKTIDHPMVPPKAHAPKKPLIVLGALFLSSLIQALFIFWRI